MLPARLEWSVNFHRPETSIWADAGPDASASSMTAATIRTPAPSG